MIFIDRPKADDALDERNRAHLAKRKAEVALVEPESSVISSKWGSFTQGKGKDEEVGPNICRKVKSSCRDKCVYCESPSAQTVDHFWPKTDYPAKMFDWENLLAACRDCNSEKRTEFPLDNGEPRLIDPTRDEPLEHFDWDQTSGECLYREDDVRAVETASIIKMDRFQRMRVQKLSNFRYFLARSVNENPISAETCDRIREELDASMPYLCILRSYFLRPNHPKERELVRRAIRVLPDILDWVRPWLLPPTGVAWPP